MESSTRNKNQKGFTLLEMVIVIVCIGWLGLIVLDRVWKYRLYAEETSVTATIGNIRSALGLEIAELAVRGQVKKIATLDKTNPFELLAQKPRNYLGEVDNVNSINDKGVWYFDKQDRTLNYIVSYPDNFISNVTGIKRTRHQLQLVFKDNNNNKRFDAGIDDISGLDMVDIEPYRWIIKN